MIFVLVGILVSFVIERFIHWHHCHGVDHGDHVHPVGYLVLIGDAVHNILDGILIATSYMVSIPLGIATTIAVILHEVPQEIGDFAVLLHSGFSKLKALLFNFVSALTAFLGAFLAIVLSGSVHNIEEFLIPIAAGHFLYIAGSDLIPELHKETSKIKSALQLLFMIGGVVLMFGITGNHNHADHDDHNHELHSEVHSLLPQSPPSHSQQI